MKKQSKISVVLRVLVIFVFVLNLAIPYVADAKVIKPDFSPLITMVNSNTMYIANSSVHSSVSIADVDQLFQDMNVDSGDSIDDINKAERLNAYFEKRNMPLAGYGIQFVRAANKYNVDWRLVAAIGVRESSGGKHLMNNNPFGWGSAKIKFADFDEAIEVVTANMGGANPNTARYYKNTSTEKKLWYYNGTVMPSYPDEVMDIMNKF